ncbi:signal peptidase II [Herpetosiphon llansteffanensis]|uniref:signal peptidase II n=1 Tax=Herpetosiphon llansteffanensis TaxID=2094568 RepID=UPI000D7C052A|nr:signal peptidase II [Herpetosiphon llansteffanensis]
MVRSARSTAALPLLIGLSIVLVDQGLKRWVLHTLVDGPPLNPIPGMLRLVFVRNSGMAFGLFHGYSALIGVLAGLIIGGMLWWTRHWFRTTSRLAQISTATLAAGGVGNVLDRIQHGYVVDFLHLPILPIFQVFNSADVAVSLGAIGLFVVLWQEDQRTRSSAAEAPRTPSSPHAPALSDHGMHDKEIS